MLIKAGAVDVIHKDDLDSVRIAEALARMHAAMPGNGAETGKDSGKTKAESTPD